MLPTMLASFTSPENIGNNLAGFLYVLPLVLAIATVYKTLKLKQLSPGYLLTQVLILSATILVFLGGIGLFLYVITRLITE